MSKVSSMLRLSYGELLLIETILSMATDGATTTSAPRRLKQVVSVRDKIKAALDAAERDGLIDTAALDAELGLGRTDAKPEGT